MITRSLARRRSRGAVFVEAVLIVATMILMLMGMVFFRTYYLEQMKTSRVARAAVLAYSMGGCDEKGGPSAWVGDDMRKSAQQTRSVDQETRPAQQLKPAPTSSGASAMMAQIPGAPVGGNALFPVAKLGLEVNVQATTREGALQTPRAIKSTARAKSYVVCGEEMKEGSIADLISMARSIISFNTNSSEPSDYKEDPPAQLPPEYTEP